MTLTTRLSLFFLATLAVVLTAFSVTLYFLARENLFHESEEHLDGALNALIGTAEIESDGVQWLPASGESSRAAMIETWGQLVWMVRDDNGRMIDHSAQPDVTKFLIAKLQSSTSTHTDGEQLNWQGTKWLVRQFIVTPKRDDTGSDPEPVDAFNAASIYPSLSITVAISLKTVETTLLQLATVLIAISAAIWLVALFLGRALCRRALLPLIHMSAAAAEIDAAALERRLPIGSTRDELQDLGRSFNSLLDRLQESFESQRRFTSDASHQLRTPLAAILGQTEVALRRQRTPIEYQHSLNTIHETASQLRRIVEALLFLARADAEASPPHQERLNLAIWLTSHLQGWSQHERSPDLVFENNVGQASWIDAHPVLLGELVSILLDNACKYSPPGTQITVRLTSAEHEYVLAVQDRGIGLAETELAELFTPFFRSAASRGQRIEGIGLGLSIAKRLATAFSGSLSAISQRGEGSCFTLCLPRAADAPEAAPDKAEFINSSSIM